MFNTVEISLDTFIRLLDLRRAEVEPRGWIIPDGVWDYYIDLLENNGASPDPDKNDPMYIVDNLAVNGDYSEVSNYYSKDEINSIFLDFAINHYDYDFIEEDDEGNILNIDEIIEEAKTDPDAIDYLKNTIEKTNEKLLFTYDDNEYEFGFGLCYSLYIA